MEPISALIGGGASLLGSIFSSSTSAQNTQANIAAQEMMQQQTQNFNAQQAQINRDYQTQMSNTAYQRASSDMKSAGLNPMMMFGSGGPAGVPGGSQASVGTPNMALSNRTSPFANLGDVVSKAVSTAGGVKALEKQTEDTRHAKADADLAESVSYKSKLSEKQAELDALEAAQRYGLPKSDIFSHATSDYIYGDWGSKVAKPYLGVVSGLNRLVDEAIRKATGPAAKAMQYFSSDAPRNFDERYGNWNK